MFRFVTTDAESIAKKRKQGLRACETCRAKKKRCDHVADASPPSTPPPVRPERVTPRARNTDQSGPTGIGLSDRDAGRCATSEPQSSTANQNIYKRTSRAHDAGAVVPMSKIDASYVVSADNDAGHGAVRYSSTRRSPQGEISRDPVSRRFYEAPGQSRSLSTQEHPRFIGDLAPEGAFLAVDRVADQPVGSDVGIWRHDRDNDPSPDAMRNYLDVMLSLEGPSIMRRLKERSLATLPPESEAGSLFRCFASRYHPILPIIDNLDADDFSRDRPFPVILLQGMYLVASMHPSMVSSLRLEPNGLLLTHREFGKRVWSAMKTNMEINIETDKVILIQASVLMWMFQEGPDAIETSSTVCARAVQYVHSLGLHLARDKHVIADGHKNSILCCVWAIDRMNAASHGRPVLMHDRDFGLNLADCIASQPPCARLFFRVIQWLDQVIQLYCPKPSYRGHNQRGTEIEIDRMSFEAMIIECGAVQVHSHLIETIEIMYCATAILSDRPQNFSTGFRQTFVQAQREQTAHSVVSSVARDATRTQLSYLPFIPYAVSLSMSVDYAALRQTRIPIYRERARDQLKADCDLLEHLSETFDTTRAMVKACRKALNEYDRVATEMTERADPHRNENVTTALTTGQSINNVQGDTTLNLDDIDVFQFFDPEIGLDNLDAQFAGNLNPFEPFYFDSTLGSGTF